MQLIDRFLLLIVPLALVLPLAACAPGARGSAPRPAVSASLFEQHVARLAADEFEGRKPASAGERRTLEYLTEEFRRLGLVPGNGESYLQPVPVVEITAGSDARLGMRGAAGVEQLRVPDEAVFITRRVVPEVQLEASPVVFVGYGVVAPEFGWNDYEGLDVRGKTVLILINDPGFATDDQSLFRGRALTYYGRWTYKFEEAARQGAAAALIVHETEPASYPWEVVVNGWTGPQLDKAAPGGDASRLKIEGWITSDVAQRLLTAAGQDFEELKLRANRRGFRPLELPIQAEGALRNAIRTSTSANVIGILKGSRRPRESVLYMAHWDHLGRSFAPGDNIFNGASDNATGVAGLLAIAEAFSRARRPERSIVFLAVTLEESGLLGSAHYVDDPLLPLEHTAAVINMDNLYFGGPTRDVRVVGHGASELEEYLAAGGAPSAAGDPAGADAREGVLLPLGSLQFREARRAFALHQARYRRSGMRHGLRAAAPGGVLRAALPQAGRRVSPRRRSARFRAGPRAALPCRPARRERDDVSELVPGQRIPCDPRPQPCDRRAVSRFQRWRSRCHSARPVSASA